MLDRPQTASDRRSLFDDGRGMLPNHISFAAPVGMRADIKRAAAAAGTTAAAFIRSALVERLQAAEGSRA